MFKSLKISTVVILLFSISFFSNATTVEEKDNVPYTYRVSLSDAPSLNIVTKIWAKIGSRSGYQFTVFVLPAERSLISVNKGEMDIEHTRLETLDLKNYPNLIRTKEYMYTIKTYAYVLKKSLIHINNWNDLLDKDISICYQLGYKDIEQNLQKKSHRLKLNPVNDAKQCLGMLKLNRVDLVLSTDVLPIELFQKKLEIEAPEVRIAGTLSESKFYPYFNQKHKNIIPKIDKIILQLRKENFFQNLINGKSK
ncbi:hypothetical protein SHI21_03085 [Bacteriovorax sp. PP10]|uniref:Solute-binding protein family 3/N-terminal domain-containing protein n=1 Tax=Bacteriovorax antarcticus TaxID=3088717 RepID=A0ABU5VQ50_9BACT|nr:hypothetical protein [Bacteriovorax sp. PP10]MEA9355165.1 hypothetical protein [Bacteriovorax sp. PP10]